VPGAIFRYAQSPDGQSTVEYMSPGCLDIWEVPADSVIEDATPLWAAVLPEHLEAMQASIARSMEMQETWLHRWRIRTPSGRLKWLEGHGRPSPPGPDGTVLWNSVILDVTVEVEAEERAQESQRLLMEASKQEGIGRLAGGIAHDFNNLLSIIMGSAELLKDNEDPEEANDLLAAILGAAERGGELTRRLLSFARRSTLAPEAFDPSEVIAGLRELIRRAVSEDIAIEISAGKEAWPIEADRNFFENAVLNLCVNARDAMVGGGTLRVTVDSTVLDTDALASMEEAVDLKPGRYVTLKVSDTGSGIDACDLAQIFEPFYTTKQRGQGSGLGLAMVHGFVRQSGGTIMVESFPGEGTAFTLFFPASGESAEPADRRAAGQRKTLPDGITVLWAEDEAPLRRVVQRMLVMSGATVVTASSADEAWARFQETPDVFDLVLSDVVMPGKRSGTDLIAEIRRLGYDTPAIFVSGYPREAMLQSNRLEADDRVLTKPIKRDVLMRVIGEVLAEAR
jgi:signal transduction histidine kinase/CheY-like chemotaxis protein